MTEQEAYGHGRAVRALSRASGAAFVANAILLGYIAFGARPDVRPAMGVVVVAVLAVTAACAAGAQRCVTPRPAALVAWCNMVAFAALAYLDGGVATPIGYAMLCTLPLAAIVMRPRRLVPFVAAGLASYGVVVRLGEPAPPGYVMVHCLAFVLLTVVAAHHAEALRALRARLARIAEVDPLTGCLNRGAFDRRLLAEVARARRVGTQVSLILLDLDGFKQVNDELGHDAGDDLLAWTGATLRDGVRSHDVVGRVGGDEFAVVLTAGPGDAAATAARLRDALAARVATSVGHGTWPVDAVDVEGVRHAADGRLYADKAVRTDEGPVRLPAPAPPSDVAPARGAEPADDEAAAPVRGAEPADAEAAAPPNVLRLLLGRALDAAHGPWHLALLQIGALGATSSAVALWYVVGFSRRGAEPWMVATVVAGLVLGAVVVAFAARLAHVRARRLLVTALNIANAVLVLVVLVGDGGVDSPLALGLLNSIPLVALSAAPRLAVRHVAALTAAYASVAAVMGASDGWMVASHLTVAHSLAFAYGVHARYAARQRHELRRVSRSDALTGCLNRRGFEQSLAVALDRTERTGRPVSLLVLDLDRFKAVNDSHGHGAGDVLLRWVGARLREECRPYDAVCRLGGDEFAVVLPDIDARGATALAERLRDVLGRRTSVSIGVATWTEGDDRTSLYRRADRVLYAEKGPRRG